MTRHELFKQPLTCKYKGTPGILAIDSENEDSYIYFLSDERNGLTCQALLIKYPQYKYTYAISPCYDKDGHIDFFKSDITHISHIYSSIDELIFKKQIKFSL